MKRRRNHYFDNASVLREIHKSKLTYCSFVSDEYTDYDVIVRDLRDIDWDRATAAAAKRLGVPQEEVRREQVVVRLHTNRHILEWMERNGGVDEARLSLQYLRFQPFQHLVRSGSGWREVGRSHWHGDFETGRFSVEHGQMTERLTRTILELARRYGGRSNWRGYSWLPDMEAQAVLNLVEAALKFDESQSSNPFGYYTRTAQNAFMSVLAKEEKILDIRDRILEDAGYSPRFDTQGAREIERRAREVR